jgi:hypothetical protein
MNKYYFLIERHIKLSSNLEYHVNNNIPLQENIFRINSEAWCNLICEARFLVQSGQLKLSNSTDRLLTEAGKLKTGTKAVYKGESVVLDSPKRSSSGPKKFYVYRDSGRKNPKGVIIAKIIRWGDPNLKVDNCDDKARKSFLARHKCSQKTDMNTPGWWACNVHRFAKQLGLACDKPW